MAQTQPKAYTIYLFMKLIEQILITDTALIRHHVGKCDGLHKHIFL